MVQVAFTPNRAYPSIPTIGADLESHSRALEAIREALQIHERRSKDIQNSFVRVSDLEDLGIIELQTGADTSVPSVVDDGPTEETTFHHHDSIYIQLDGSSPFTSGQIDFGAGIRLANATGIEWLDIAAADVELLSFEEVTGTDDQWSNVLLLLEMEGAYDTVIFNDTSSYARTVTPSGNVYIDSLPFGYDDGAVFDGDEDALFVAHHADFNFGSGDFTVECFLQYWNDPGTEQAYITKHDHNSGNGNQREWWFGTNATATALRFMYSTDGLNQLTGPTAAWNPTDSVWYHLAASRSGNNMYIFVDGILLDTFDATGVTFYSGTADVAIGALMEFFIWDFTPDGWIDGVRITKDYARYTANFTAPLNTAFFPNSGDTEMLVLGDASYVTKFTGSDIHVIPDMHLKAGAAMYLWDADGQDNVSIYHDGQDIIMTGFGTCESLILRDIPLWFWLEDQTGISIGYDQSGDNNLYCYMTDQTEFSFFHVGVTDWRIEDLTNLGFFTGVTLDIYDPGDTDFVSFNHDGADFNTVGTNTADWNISGFTAINAGTVDVDFDAITATSYGGILEANLLSRIVAEPISGAWVFNGELTFTDKLNAHVTTVTATSFTADDDHVILVDDDTAGSTVTITLPPAATANTIYHVKKLGTTASVIVDGDGTETIDGALTATLNTQYESIMLVSDGSNWHVI